MMINAIRDSRGEAPRYQETWGFRLCTTTDAVASWIMGTSLIFSSIPHLTNPYYFLGTIYSYRLIGPGVGQFVAIVLPWLQVVLGICLVTHLLHHSAHTLTMGVLVIFVAVQASALLRQLDISCGCFGVRHEAKIDGATLMTTGALLMLSFARFVSYKWRATTQQRVGKPSHSSDLA